MRNSAAALAAVSAAANSVAGATVGGSVSLSGAGGALGAEAAMLEELFEDANAADQLNRELEASLAKANAEVLELKEKVRACNEDGRAVRPLGVNGRRAVFTTLLEVSVAHHL